MNFLKNIAYSAPVGLAGEVQYLDGQIVSRTLSQNEYHSLTLFAFSKGEEIGEHDSNGDAFVYVLDGKGKISLGGKEHIVTAGQAIVMPAKVPHAVSAPENFKMLLLVLFK